MSDDRDLCSPSQLNLRFHCPGSANLQKKLPMGSNYTSEAAERGTFLHSVVCSVLGGAKIESVAFKNKVDAEAVMWCLRRIREDILSRFTETQPVLKREFQIDLSDLGIFGGKEGCRIDQLFVLPAVGCIVIDEKFGIGYVPPPKYNLQFKAYAWGAWKAFGGSVETIKLQPAVEEEKQCLIHVFEEDELETIGDEIRAIVEKTKPEDAPLIRGPHCEYLYCKCKDICPLHRQAALEIPQGIMVRDHLKAIEPAQRRELYTNLLTAENWVHLAISIIESMVLGDEIEIPGVGKGEGRGSYVWKDEADAAAKIQEFLEATGGTDKYSEAIFVPSSLKSKSAIEEIIGKSKPARALLEPLFDKIPGKPCVKFLKGNL
jgi:hypothetical protein